MTTETLDGCGLTGREQEVFWLVAERLRNREISERLHIGVRTVESHVSTILRKVGGEQRDDIVELAGRLARRRINGTPPPAPLSSFIGRDAEAAELSRLVATERLVTVVGPPGVGKTRLAFHVARMAVDLPPPVLVDLATTGTEEGLLRVFTSALGLTEAGVSLRRALHEALRPEPVWLIVDNCEHVGDSVAALLRELLGIGAGLRVLATSRSALGIDGEWVFDLSPLGVHDETDVLDAAACRLFLDRAKRLSERAVTDEHAHHIADLCRRVDGLPLAIELAAAQTRWFSVVELLAQLDDRLLAFDDRRSGLPDRHRTVAAAVRWSYDLLDEDEQCLLQRCSVFPGGFELDMLVDVAGFDGLDAGGIVRLLPRLVDRSLVAARELADQTTSYRLLDSIRSFARSELMETGELDRVEERHARAHLARAAAVSTELTDRRQQPALDWFHRRWDDLRLAMRWMLAHDDTEAAWTFLAAVGRRWLVVGSRGEVLEWMERLLERPMPGGRLGAAARLTAAHVMIFTDTARAARVAEEARSLLGEDDADLWAMFDLTSGRALAQLGQTEEGSARLDRALASFRASGDAWHEALALQGLGGLARDTETSLQAYRRSARRFRDLGDDVMLGNTRTLMVTRALMVDPDHDGIDDWLAEARVLGERTGSQWELAHVAMNEQLLRVHRGATDGVEDALGGLVVTFRQMVDPRCTSRGLVGLGTAAIRRGDDEAAVVHLRAAAETAQRISFAYSVVGALRLLAGIDERAGDACQAARMLGRADVAGEDLDPIRLGALPDVDALRGRLSSELGDDRASALVREGREAAPGFPW